MSDELFDIVNDGDAVVGQTTRREAHTIGHIHRSVLFCLLDEQLRVFVNQRTASKDFYPEYWSVVFGGHVPAGETYEQSVEREADEETGVVGVPIFAGAFQKRFDAQDRENVRVYAFVTTQSPRLDPQEIQRGEFVALKHLGVWLDTHSFLPETTVVMPMLQSLVERLQSGV